MREYLNTPEHIEAGFLNIQGRISQVENAIGKESISTLSKQLADLLYHVQLEDGSLNSLISSNKTQSHISIGITNASVELQSAYHFLTIGNIPSVFRQCRIANEFIAVVVFLAVSKEKLTSLLSAKKHSLIDKLIEHEDSSFWDLYGFETKKVGKIVQRKDPIIKGNMLLKPFLEFLKVGLGFKQSEVQTLRKQIYDVQHPSSHGSLDIFTYHFIDVENGGKVGINYSENKVQEYRHAINYLVWNTKFSSNVLEEVYKFLKFKNET